MLTNLGAMRSATQAVQAVNAGVRALSVQSLKSAARAGETIPALDNSSRGPSGVLEVPTRILMGPGPANAHPRVLAAQSLPLLGHMHPPFLKIMDEVQGGLRYAMQTQSKYTLLASGTGHAGMEMCIANLVEPGDKVLVGNAGIWGERVAEMTRRFRGDVVEVKAPLGEALSYTAIKDAVTAHKPKLLFLCQGESSTGTHQGLAGVGEVCRAHGCLLLVDAVCTLGGVPLFADAWEVDAIYSGSQKCLSAPPGAAPVYFGERALAKLQARSTPPATYNLDLNLVGDYWGWFNKRSYHHTGPVSTFYALREALAIVSEEGLDKLWARHQDMHQLLWEGLRGLGLKPFVEKEEFRLATVNTVRVPEGVDWAALCKFAMDRYQVEIAGGLGPTVGKVWRVGVMGYNARPQNIELVVAAFREGLKAQGWRA